MSFSALSSNQFLPFLISSASKLSDSLSSYANFRQPFRSMSLYVIPYHLLVVASKRDSSLSLVGVGVLTFSISDRSAFSSAPVVSLPSFRRKCQTVSPPCGLRCRQWVRDAFLRSTRRLPITLPHRGGWNGRPDDLVSDSDYRVKAARG